MARISLILNVLLILAVGYLFMDEFGDDQAEKPAEEQKENTDKKFSPQAESNIRYINTDTLWEHYEYIKEAKAELEEVTQQMQSTFDSKIASFQKEVESFQKDARYMTRAQGQKKQQELVQREQELGQLQENLAQRMSEKRNELNEKIRKKITGFLDKYNAEKNYNFILSYAQGGAILEASDSLDITNEVLEQMNAEYFENNSDSTATAKTDQK